MILDPRRRIRDRLLIGMVAVALLPLATFALLAAIDLDAIGRSTAEAAQGAILQDEQRRQQATVTDNGSVLQTLVVAVDSDLLQLRQAAAAALAHGTAASAAPMVASGDACYTATAGASAAVAPCAPSAAESRVIGVSAALVPRMQLMRRDHPEIAAVWLANQRDTAVRAVPGFNIQAALSAGRLDPIDPSGDYRGQMLAKAAARFQHQPNAWSDPGSGESWSGGPFWTDPYPLVGTGATGVTAWIPVGDGSAMVGADVALTTLVSAALTPASGSPLPPGSYPLLVSSDGTVIYAGPGASLDFRASGDLTGSQLPAPASAQLAASLSAFEATGQTGGAPLTATLAGVTKDIFSAAVYPSRWILMRPVPLADLQPDLAGLTTGVTSGVHHLYPLVVLPALVLLLGLAFVAATLLSRRMVGPVRQLTAAAERLARGETDVPVPPQGRDELGVLADSLERMRRDITSSHDTIVAAAAELEGRVAQRTKELRARNDELVALNDLAASLTRSLEPHVILADALDAVKAIQPLLAGRGYVLEGEALSAAAAMPDGGVPIAREPELDALAAEVVQRRRPLRRRSAGATLLAWPLLTRQGLVGALAVRTQMSRRSETGRLLQAVADQVALALHTSLLSAAGREHAVLEERTRLAREIHDTIAQQLTGIVIQLEAAQTLVQRGSGQAESSVESARELARAALQEARRSVWNLRPAPLAATGLVAALEREVSAWESRSGVRARFRARSVPPRPNLQPAAEVALLRTLQEALSNVARHSHATTVRVVLRMDGDDIVLSVHDDGAGFEAAAAPPRPDCFGLEGMRQRVRHAGGSVAVVSSPGAGTEVIARFPLEAQAVADSA